MFVFVLFYSSGRKLKRELILTEPLCMFVEVTSTVDHNDEELLKSDSRINLESWLMSSLRGVF